jgi:hypothetical protein
LDNKRKSKKYKNSRDTLKTAVLAVNQIPRRGVEHLKPNQQGTEKELAGKANPVFATGLTKIVEKCSELEQIITRRCRSVAMKHQDPTITVLCRNTGDQKVLHAVVAVPNLLFGGS